MRGVRHLVAALMLTGSALAFVPAHAATITLNATVRDFCGWNFSGCPAGYSPNPDFENGLGDSHGVVQTTLGGDGTPVYAAGAHPTFYGTDTVPALGTLTAAQYFGQWFHDTAGFNQTTTIGLTFTDPGTGIYTYNNPSFFPIDNQLLGNQGQGHNFSFTTQLHTTFTYQTGQTFSFTGDDDVWVFLNNQLAIDLGGVHGAESTLVNLNTLGLTAGNTYNFDLFFAERHTSASDLRIDTSIVFNPNPPVEGVPEPVTISLFSMGLAGAVAIRRRNKKSR
jgi:fibro-slime domain-containing protein